MTLQRLIPYLDQEGLDYVVYNTGRSTTNHPRIVDIGWSLKWMLRMLLSSRHQVMQVSTSRWQVRFFGALVSALRGTRLIVYARGYSLPDSYFQGGVVKRRLVRWALRRAERVFAPNPDLAERIASIGFDAKRIDIIPPFIPPATDAVATEIPVEVQRFCEGKGPFLVANGAYVLVNDQDVYGLRALAQLVRELLPRFPRLAVVVYMRAGAHREMSEFADLIAEVHESPLRDHLLLYDSTGEFFPVLAIADVFLRPTTTDGDANSIREALHVGVPVVASDVIPRPEGCRTYPANTPDALRTTVESVLDDLAAERAKAAAAPKYNAAEVLLPIYRELAAGK
ncbi:MAG: glycosyltransferase [Phycisphaerales bacterium]|nr:glycosyltransferase [Phycisphaerales bacterium]